jgi:signal transduction histidine kinase
MGLAMIPSPRGQRRVALLVGAILAPALTLAVLSWRSLRQEREERRAELVRLASSAASAALHGLEREIAELAERTWRSAGNTVENVAGTAAGGGGIFCVRNAEGRMIYPRPLETDSPSLEERIRRENPDLLHSLSGALQTEFARADPGEASVQYRKLEDQVETASTHVALLHARARAASRSGRKEDARALYERLSREPETAGAESGIPYQVLATVRLIELDPGPDRLEAFHQALARHAIPGHARLFLLGDLPKGLNLGEPIASARALERLEGLVGRGGAPEDEIVRIDERPFLLSYRAFPGGSAGAAIRLESFPSPPAREALLPADAIACEIEKIDPPAVGEVLVRQASPALPTLAVLARLVDPARLEVPRSRLALTGGLVACLVAALLFGTFALLRTVRRELAVAQLKSDFVSGVSHDLKTPLTSIRMFAEMLADGRVTGEEKRRDYQHLIHRESLRLSRLVENVLDFSRIEEGRKTFAFSEHHLKDVVASAVETFRALSDGQSVRIRTDLSGDPLVARLDRDAVLGAILNLLDNALKYGGEAKEIEVALVRTGSHGEISVRDQGPGIPEAERERLFEKFYRGSRAVAGPAGGAGLGLTLVRHVMEAHHGSVRAESEPGKGSRFVLSLPLCPESSS